MSSKKCKVSAVVDFSSERREYVSGLYPAVKVTENTDEILGDPEIEAVVIATPVASHFDLAMRAQS